MLLFVVFRTVSALNAANNGGSANVNTNTSASVTAPAPLTDTGQAGTQPVIVSAPVAGGTPGAFPNPDSALMNKAVGLKGAKLDLYADTLGEPSATKDPFTPIVPLPGTVRTNFVSPTRPVQNFAPPVMRGFPGPSVMPVAPRPADSVQALPTGPSPLDDVLLAGVIAGSYSVAVVHIGARSYELVGGEKLPYDLTLTRITDSGVYMRRGTRLVFIPIGKTLRAAMPIKEGGFARDPGRSLLSATPEPSKGEVTLESDAPTPASKPRDCR